MAKAKLVYDGKEYEFNIVEGSEGERAIDISKLRDQTGLVTLDTGYMNTGSCQSSITFLDGEKGILRYRGYPIEQLAEQSSFVEVSYLLIYGRLPNRAELNGFRERLTRHTMLHEDMKRFFDGYPHTAHPMAILSAMVCSSRSRSSRRLRSTRYWSASWYRAREVIRRGYPLRQRAGS